MLSFGESADPCSDDAAHLIHTRLQPGDSANNIFDLTFSAVLAVTFHVVCRTHNGYWDEVLFFIGEQARV